MSEYNTPKWLQAGDLVRVKKSEIPTEWNSDTMKKFLMDDDVGLLRGANVVAKLFEDTPGDQVELLQLREAMSNTVPGSIVSFVCDINKSWKNKKRISVAQLKGIRNVFKKNTAFIDYLVIKANEDKNGN